jgi:carbon monoxide dehydrogenase subunit G
MLRFEGDRTIAKTQADAWAKLTDPAFLVQCIPDVESVGTLEPARATLVIRPNLAFVRSTLDVYMTILDAVAPTSARVVIHSKGIGSTSTVEATITCVSTKNGTTINWSAEITELGGLLKMVPEGLIRGAAQRVLNDAWASVEKKLAES